MPRCPRCNSNKTALFPNCDYTFGCCKCAYVFTAKTKQSKEVIEN